MFKEIFLRQSQIKDLLELLNKQDKLPETLEDIKAQLLDLSNSTKLERR